MRFITAFGQIASKKWKRLARASMTMILLSTVAVVGLTLIVSKVSAALKTPGYAEQALASGHVLQGLLDFEAPAATVAQFEAKKEESENSLKKARDAMVAQRWKFTASPFEPILELIFSLTPPGSQIVANARTQYLLGLAIVAIDGVIDSNPGTPGLAFLDRYFATLYSIIQSSLTNYNNFVNSLGLPSLDVPLLPPLPSPATPFF